MARPRFVSNAEMERMLRRAGYPNEEIEEMLRDLPDPVDTERHAVELTKRGMTLTKLTDRRGGSP